jgi:signal transduction histidine kinase
VTIGLTGELPKARQRARQKARFLFGASGLIVLAHAVDVVQADGPNWPALALRVGWACLLLVNAVAIVRAKWSTSQAWSTVAGLGTALFYLALLAVTGRSHSPLFAFAFPLAMLLPPFMGELIRAALLSAALLLLGAWAMLFADGASFGEHLGWGHAGAVAFMVAWLLGTSELRARMVMNDLSRRREEDLLRLAESERLAAVGRVAARVAHEVNNPLAAAKATAGFLREHLSSPDGDAQTAWRDLVGTLDRIAGLVRRLGDETRGMPGAGTRHPTEPGE